MWLKISGTQRCRTLHKQWLPTLLQLSPFPRLIRSHVWQQNCKFSASAESAYAPTYLLRQERTEEPSDSSTCGIPHTSIGTLGRPKQTEHQFGDIVSGVFTPVLAKHSKSFSLVDCLSVGVDRMQRNFEPMRSKWKHARKVNLRTSPPRWSSAKRSSRAISERLSAT